jgi:tRNA/tmRNA/rRNA uracil-C5-methylase (TrmA/RlmC/RlmD family)
MSHAGHMHVSWQGVCLVPPTDYVVLCDRALPGERLRAQVTDVRRGYAVAEKVKSLAPHNAHVMPQCPHFGPCGGCSLQSLSYEAQLREKQNQASRSQAKSMRFFAAP